MFAPLILAVALALSQTQPTNATLETEIKALSTQISTLITRVQALEAGKSPTPAPTPTPAPAVTPVVSDAPFKFDMQSILTFIITALLAYQQYHNRTVTQTLQEVKADVAKKPQQ